MTKNKSEQPTRHPLAEKRFGYKTLIVSFFLGYLTASFLIYLMSPKEVKHSPASQPSVTAPMQNSAVSPLAALEAETVANPNEPHAWIHLGNFLFDSDQFQKAIKAYEKALELDRNNPNVLVDCGVMYRRINQSEKAIELFEEAFSQDPMHTTALMNIGIVSYYDLGNFSKAKEAWLKLLAINPNAMGPDNQTLKDFVDSMDGQ